MIERQADRLVSQLPFGAHIGLFYETPAGRHAIISELIAEAVQDPDPVVFAQVVARLVARCLGATYAKVMELLPGGTQLLLRAGVGWGDGLVGRAIVDAGIDSQAGYTLLMDEPVLVDDLRQESRFRASALLLDHGITSGISTIIRGHGGPWGVLSVHTSGRREFRAADVEFLQAVAHVMALAIDRRRLIDGHARWRAVMKCPSIAIIGTDLLGIIVRWSRGAERLVGYSPAQIIGRAISILIPSSPGQPADTLPAWIERGEALEEHEVTIVRRDGRRVDVALSLAFTESEGEALLLLRDISDWKRLEADQSTLLMRERAALARAEIAEAGRESDARFRRLVESTSDCAMMLVDPQGRIASWNEGAQRLFGYRTEETVGHHLSMISTPEDRQSGSAARLISHAANHGRSELIGWRVRKDGSQFRARTAMSALHDDAGRLSGFAGVIHELADARPPLDLAPPDPISIAAKAPGPADERERLALFLPTVPIFQNLPAPLLDRLAALAPIKQHQHGEFIFLEEDPIVALHILLEGQVKLIRETEEGRGIILRLINPGEIFGFTGFDGRMTQRLSAQANGDVTVIEIPTDEFIHILTESPESLRSALHAVGTMLGEVETRICDLQTRDAESRLAAILLQVASGAQTASKTPTPVTLTLTRQDLADLAGTNLSTASRAVSAWAKAGYLIVGRAKITIRDDTALRSIAQETRSRLGLGRAE